MVEGRGGEITETFAADGEDVGALRFLPPPRWRLVRRAGIGGQAEVWLAEDRELGQEVALKVFRRAPDPVAVERMRREVRLGRELSHSGLVRIFDLVQMDGVPVAVMEWVPGGSLADLVAAEGPLAVDRVVEIADQVLDTLEYLHERGIVHRDVKPSNLFLDAEGRVRLGDLGLARSLSGSDDLTRTKMTVGTPTYMAPEQLRGEEPAPAADLYALGVTLYELLSGRPPFVADSEFEVADAVLHGRASSLHAVRPDCPRWLASFVHRLLERAPRDRFPDAGAAHAAFRRRRAVASPRKMRFLAAALTAAALLLGSGAAAVRLLGAPAPLDHVEQVGDRLVAYGADGGELWRRQLRTNRWAVGDLLGSPGPEVAVERVRDGDHRRVVVEILGRDGREEASVTLHAGANLGTLEVSPDWALQRLEAADLDGDGRSELIWAISHRVWFPGAVGLWSPRLDGGNRLVVVNSGRIHDVEPADLDGDGVQELVATAVNNPLGFQGVLVIRSLGGIEGGMEDAVLSPDLRADTAGSPNRAEPFFSAYVPLGSRLSKVRLVAAGPDGIVVQAAGERVRLDRWGNPEWSPAFGSGWEARRHFWDDLAVLCRRVRDAPADEGGRLWRGFCAEHRGMVAEPPSETAAALLVARSMADGGHPVAGARLLEETAARVEGERDLLLRSGEYRLIAGDREGGRADIRRSLPVEPGGRNPFDQFVLLALDAVVHGDVPAFRDVVRDNRSVIPGSIKQPVAEKFLPALLWARGQWEDPRLDRVERDPTVPVLGVVAAWVRLARGEDPEEIAAAARTLEEQPDVREPARLLHAAAELEAGDARTALGLAREALDAIDTGGLRSYELYCWRHLACLLAAEAALAQDDAPSVRPWLEAAAAAGPDTWYGRRAAALLAGLGTS